MSVLGDLTTSIPGVDEALTLSYISKMVTETSFDKVVFDTAPTGHTLRLLNFPKLMGQALEKLLQMKENLGGIYYSPNQTRQPSNTSEGEKVKSQQAPEQILPLIRNAFGGYFEHIENFIDQMNKVFEFGDDWGIYIPEVKYLSPEPLVDYPNVHFVGDALSARGITVSGAQGIYVAEYLL